MPQPLSKFVRQDQPWALTFDAAELRKKPGLAALIAETVAKASAMEHGMAMILVQLLHASPEPAFAMFSEVMDSSNKRSMILAAARSALPPDDFETFEVIAAVYRTQMDVRNKFAHWLWGSCEQVGDGLLLVDPRYMLKHARNQQQIWATREELHMRGAEGHDQLMEAIRYDFEKIYVYRQNDFEHVLRDIDETLQMLGNFCFILDPSTSALDRSLKERLPDYQNLVDEARQKLPSLRLFSEALTRLRNARQKS